MTLVTKHGENPIRNNGNALPLALTGQSAPAPATASPGSDFELGENSISNRMAKLLTLPPVPNLAPINIPLANGYDSASSRLTSPSSTSVLSVINAYADLESPQSPPSTAATSNLTQNKGTTPNSQLHPKAPRHLRDSSHSTTINSCSADIGLSPISSISQFQTPQTVDREEAITPKFLNPPEHFNKHSPTLAQAALAQEPGQQQKQQKKSLHPKPSRSLSYLKPGPLHRRISHRKPNLQEQQEPESMSRNKKPSFFRRLFGAKELNSISPKWDTPELEQQQQQSVTVPLEPRKESELQSKQHHQEDDHQLDSDDQGSEMTTPEPQINARSDSLRRPQQIAVPRKPVPRLKLEPNSPFKPDLNQQKSPKTPVGLGLSTQSDSAYPADDNEDGSGKISPVIEEKENEAAAEAQDQDQPNDDEDSGPPLPPMATSNTPTFTAPYSTKSSPMNGSSISSPKFTPLVNEHKTSSPMFPHTSPYVSRDQVKRGSVSSNSPSTAQMSSRDERKNSAISMVTASSNTSRNSFHSPEGTPNSSSYNHSTNGGTELSADGVSRSTAQKLYDGTLADKSPDEYAQWLGSDGPEQSSVRVEYMNLFDWTSKSILHSLRMLCDKLYMKGESQQLNRVIEAFSQAWVNKNPNHGFYDANVVYTIAYALILLNTDIYGADHTVQKKMAKSAFVQNTLETIRAQARAEKQASKAMNSLNGGATTEDNNNDENENDDDVRRAGSASPIPFKRLSNSLPGSTSNLAPYDTTALVGESSVKPLTKEWEFHLETILKVFYSSIAKEALKLHLVENNSSPSISASIYSSSNANNNGNGNSLKPTTSSSTPSLRSASRSSRTGSGTSSSLFGRMSSKFSRSGRQNGFENQSRLQNFSDRADSMRRDSLNSTFSFESNYSTVGRHAVGFAGLLWNSMIREEESSQSGIPEDDDDFADFSKIEQELAKEVELELHGAPWTKEGLLMYRPYVDPTTGKRSKKKDWVQVFVVVQRGQLKIFKFDLKNGKAGNKKSVPANGVVGGGNWMDNAELVDGFHLCHTMAQELPPPKKPTGYAALWSLALPQRGLLVFQAGTLEIAQEFVYTCNYWAGRLSKEPFEEPVSSMEFGWGASIEPAANSSSSSAASVSRQASISTLRNGGGARGTGNNTTGMKPGDRFVIKEWRPTGHSLIVSDLNEEKQLANLKAYVQNAENKLTQHNSLRSRMMNAFTPGSPNWNKAQSNWERKSQYLLQQLIRFKTYVEYLERGHQDKMAHTSDSIHAVRTNESMNTATAEF